MELLAAYLPTDRRHALARGADLPAQTSGAALFADISGFTPLTEALLTTLGPQRGAEELSRQLNRVYDALIAEVDRYRGSVLVFSGDAITCWFEDPVAPHRAVTCGLAMQAAMAQFAALTPAPGLTISLAMKVAIATGPARRFVVGDPAIQRIDVLAGATLDRMAAVEKHAQRGQVMVDAETLAQLEEDTDSPPDEAFRAVTRLPRRARQSPWDALPPAGLVPDVSRPWLLPPVYARLREGQAQFLAEIRPLVALFLSFTGLDYDADPAAAEQLDAFICRAQQILNRHEAYLLQLTLGDKGSYFYAAFGAPMAHDDDPARAAAAALELHAASRAFPYLRDVRVGLNMGRVWCGAYGGRTRHTYGVLGDAVNVAARLMTYAATGETIVSQNLADAVQADYDLEPAGTPTLKGKREPQLVFRVLKKRADTATLRRGALAQPLVGRAAELALLNENWRQAQGGAGRTMRLVGAPGVGKSHLAQELALEAANAGAWVGVGACHSTEQAIPYRP